MLESIKDKYLQNQFFRTHDLPTIQFEKCETKADLIDAVQQGKLSLPFVQKSRSEGYDGRGIHIVEHHQDLDHLLAVPSIAAEPADRIKELAVIVARTECGESL